MDTDTGNSVGVVAKTEKLDMAAGSRPYPVGESVRKQLYAEQKRSDSGGRRPPSPDERLEICQQSIKDLEKTGVLVRPVRIQSGIGIVLSGVDYCAGCESLRFVEQMAGDQCQYCAGKEPANGQT